LWFRLGAVGTALQAVRRNALRSALTALGIIIGVASLVATAEIGQGSATAIRHVLITTGANNLLVQGGAASSNGVSLGSGSIKALTPEDAEAIRNECPSVASAAPVVYTRRQVVFEGRNWVPMYMDGTTPALLKVRDWEDLEEGEPFTEQDVRNASMSCLLGRTLVRELFRGESPLGKDVYVNDVPLRVVGVLRAKGANIIGEDQDDVLLAPWTTIKYRVSGSSPGPAAAAAAELTPEPNAPARRYPRGRPAPYPTPSAGQAAGTPQLVRFANVDFILVRAHSVAETPAAMGQINRLLRERHRIQPGQEDDFNVQDFTEGLLIVQTILRVVEGLLLAVALCSLLVGGIGIMNIMLVSVTERTREIGLRMAVGANARAILRQFLIEAAVLSVLGGVLGIAVGKGGALLVRWLAHWPTESSLLAVVGSVAVSVTVGVAFGYYPAWKASRMAPIEALRYE
jgi:macrolide transport system ATP-binding/permease protein